MEIDITKLQALHRFGDIYEQAISSVTSEAVSLEVDRASGDSIGRHWYGMRCRMTSKKTGQGFYIHTGLIFLPETRTGLMVELDLNNNHNPYQQVWSHIEARPEFEVNKDEAEYLKLFMPDDIFTSLGGLERAEQVALLSQYVKSCAEAIVSAADGEPFRLSFKDLGNTYQLHLAFEQALKNVSSREYTVKIAYKDPDNFGQYASGYRYHLRDAGGKIDLYAYFGGIYSYKKEPAGIFTEIDWLSNQKDFDRAYCNIKEDPGYVLSVKEPKFIKLFMTRDMQDEFNRSETDKQMEILTAFLDNCNARLVEAALQK